ncbi:MAG: hypothetical protein V4558_01645 [Gemmatimonadota bacterium]
MRSRTTPRIGLLLLMAGAGCGHSEPFLTGAPPGQDGPLLVGAPTRLTYGDGMDLVASISPDGATLLYAFQPYKPPPPATLSRPDVDRCIGIMPVGGGSRREICRADNAGLDSTDAFEQASLGSDGALLYAAYASRIGAPAVNTGALRLGTVDAPYPGRVLLTTPNFVSGLSFDHFGAIRWISATSFLVEVHDQQIFSNGGNDTRSDTFPLGVGILRGELNGGQATFSMVAGTDSASGFDLSVAKDSIYFTRLDDARLYVVAIAGGTRRAVFTEPANGATRRYLRDPVRIGNRVAVVGQDYQQRENLKFPPGQPPLGLGAGSVVKAIGPGDGIASSLLATNGSNSTQGSFAAFGALAASPDGCRLVVEHRIVKESSFTTDLYSYCLGTGGSCVCS